MVSLNSGGKEEVHVVVVHTAKKLRRERTLPGNKGFNLWDGKGGLEEVGEDKNDKDQSSALREFKLESLY